MSSADPRGALALDLMSRLLSATVVACFVALSAAGWSQPPASHAQTGDAEAAYAQRDDEPQALRAVALWQAALRANPRDFDAAHKLARALNWLGERNFRDKAQAFREGMDAARVAVRLQPHRPEGHFWLAANMGALAGVVNPLSALRYKNAIRESFEQSLALDATYLHGAAYCALGKYYNALPGWVGGNKQKAEQLLRRCLTVDPTGVVGHYYLAQMLASVSRVPEARAELRIVAGAPVDVENGPEIRLWKRRAERLSKRLDEAGR